jgi:aminomethyltransferase
LFDVSHMGQLRLSGVNVAAALERLVPGDISALPVGKTRYSLLTTETGGILDDLMISNAGDHLFLVVNAACKDADLAHLRRHLGQDVAIEPLADRALLALQGPRAALVLARFAPTLPAMGFMEYASCRILGQDCLVTRSGYTGEDGFELSVPADGAADFARTLLAEPEVAPIGLGARDSLRLEAGLCLYGADLDSATTPIEADLAWTISRRRREQGGFAGSEVILGQLRDGPRRRRVGIRPLDKAPARAHTVITDPAGTIIGQVTSGGFGPSLGGPLAMGYVDSAHAVIDQEILLLVRGTPRPARITAMPFVPHRYVAVRRLP